MPVSDNDASHTCKVASSGCPAGRCGSLSVYPAAEVLGCRSCIRACIRSRLLPRTQGLYYTYSKRHDLDVTFMFPVPRAPRGAWKPALSDAADLYHPGGILSLGNSVFYKRSQATLAPRGSISIVCRTAQKYAPQEDHLCLLRRMAMQMVCTLTAQKGMSKPLPTKCASM